jgi:hypothetical protein
MFSPKVVFMAQGKRVGLSAAQKTEMWSRWKAEHSLHQIGHAFGKGHASIHFPLSHHDGIVPAARRRSLLALTLAEREDISGGIACGSSIREVAKHLQRAAWTLSRYENSFRSTDDSDRTTVMAGIRQHPPGPERAQRGVLCHQHRLSS